jgi:hypothetical protein
MNAALTWNLMALGPVRPARMIDSKGSQRARYIADDATRWLDLCHGFSEMSPFSSGAPAVRLYLNIYKTGFRSRRMDTAKRSRCQISAPKSYGCVGNPVPQEEPAPRCASPASFSKSCALGAQHSLCSMHDPSPERRAPASSAFVLSAV